MAIAKLARWSIGIGLTLLAATAFFVSASARCGRAMAETRGGSLTLSWTVYLHWSAPKGWIPPPLVEYRVEWSPSVGELRPIVRETEFFTNDGGFHEWVMVIPLWLPALTVLLWPALCAVFAAVQCRLTTDERVRRLAKTTCWLVALVGIATWVASAFVWIELPSRIGTVSIHGGAVSLGGRASSYRVDLDNWIEQPRLPWDRLIPHVERTILWPDEWVIPTWLPAAVSGGILILLRRPVRIGHCKQCAYDLTGNVSGRCPECGTATTAEELQQGPREFAKPRQLLQRRRGDADPA